MSWINDLFIEGRISDEGNLKGILGYRADQSQVEGWADATGDPNPEHRGENAVMLGTQLEALLKSITDAWEQDEYDGFHFASMKVRFGGHVRHSEPAQNKK